jgi:hypothetical protein
MSWSFQHDRIQQNLLWLTSMSGGCKSETILFNCTYLSYVWQALHCTVCQNINSAVHRHLSATNRVVPVHIMVANSASRIIAPFILNVSISCRWVVSLCLGLFTPSERIPGVCWVGAWGALESVCTFWRTGRPIALARNWTAIPQSSLQPSQ